MGFFKEKWVFIFFTFKEGAVRPLRQERAAVKIAWADTSIFDDTLHPFRPAV